MCPLWWIRQITAVLRFLPFPTAGFPPEWGLLLESNPQRPLITCKLPGMSSCWQQHPSRTSQLHTATKMQVNTSPPEWINRAASKYSSYLSFKCFPCHGCFSLCLFLLHQLFRASFGPLQTAFLFLIFLHLLLFFSLCVSLCVSTWLAVICQISPWWPACLNQSGLTSFRLICTRGDWFSSLTIIWCSIPYLPKQIKLWWSQSAGASERARRVRGRESQTERQV